MSDTFDKLIADMREAGQEDGGSYAHHVFADRLEALVTEIEPLVMPAYGSGPTPGPIETDQPPILRDLLDGKPAPGSDWVLIDPVSMTDEQAARGREHVLSEPEKIMHPGGKDGFYVVECSCGYRTSPSYPASKAQVAASSHKAAKDRALAAERAVTGNGSPDAT